MTVDNTVPLHGCLTACKCQRQYAPDGQNMCWHNALQPIRQSNDVVDMNQLQNIS